MEYNQLKIGSRENSSKDDGERANLYLYLGIKEYEPHPILESSNAFGAKLCGEFILE